MNSDRWWWSQKAQQLRFNQLELARKQADTWRTGLAGVTALLSAVLIVKGRDNFTALARPYVFIVLVLYGLALVLLLLATMAAVRAASGDPGDRITLNGEELRAWTELEVVDVMRAINAARALTAAGVCAVVVATTTAWFAPSRPLPTPLVRVVAPGVNVCGRLLQQGDGLLRVGEERTYRVIPLTAPLTVNYVTSC